MIDNRATENKVNVHKLPKNCSPEHLELPWGKLVLHNLVFGGNAGQVCYFDKKVITLGYLKSC